MATLSGTYVSSSREAFAATATASVTAAAGDTLVLIHDVLVSSAAVSTAAEVVTGGYTWTRAGVAWDTDTANQEGVSIWTARATTGSTFTVTAGFGDSTSRVHSVTVLRFSGVPESGTNGVLAAAAVRNYTFNVASTGTVALTTTTAGSSVVVASLYAGTRTGTRTYSTATAGSATEVDYYIRTGGYSTIFAAHYANAGAAGSKTVGVTSPTTASNQPAYVVAIELAPPDPLAQWKSARAAAGTARARVAVFGDSQAEGQGASTRANRWQDLMLATVRSRLGLSAGGRGAVPAKYEVYSPDSPWGTTGLATTGSVSDYAAGPFGQRARILGASSTLTWTVQGTSAQIWVGAYSGMTSWGYKIDGGSTVTVSASSPASPTWTPTTVTLGSSGSHTVQVVTNASQEVYLGGLVVFDGDATAGVTLLDAAKVGVTAATYASNANEPDSTSWRRGMSDLAPDLVIIALGLNDWNDQVAASTTVTNLQTIVTNLRALAKVPSIVIVAPKNIAPNANTATVTWSSYMTAYQNMVTADGNLTYLDLHTPMAGTGSPGGTYWTTDWHPTDAGHAMIAGLVASAVTFPVGTGSGSWVFGGAAAGRAVRGGTAGGQFTFAGSATGATTRRGSGSGSWTLAGTASGASPRRGAAAGLVSWTGAAQGAAGRAGSGAGSWSFTGSAAGVRPRRGSATGSWLFTGASAGQSARRATSAGAWAFTSAATGSAPGVPASEGSASGTVTWVGAASGAATRRGASTGAWSFTGAATGKAVRRGSAAGVASFTGSAVGRTIRAGSAAGQTSYSGSASGTAPFNPPGSGAAAGTWSTAGTATGRAVRSGSGAGGVSWVGVALSGNVRAGSATSTWQFTSTATGSVTRRGSASGSAGFSGTAVGTTVRRGNATGSWAYVSSAASGSTRTGSASSAWAFTGTAAGRSVKAGAGTGAWAWTSAAAGVAPDNGPRTGSASGTWLFVGAATGGPPRGESPRLHAGTPRRGGVRLRAVQVERPKPIHAAAVLQ